MTVERHLVLEETTLLPSTEWPARGEGWIVARVAEGAGYWLNGPLIQELGAGDMFAVPGGANGSLRASRLGPLRLQFFRVRPRLLSGLLAVAHNRQLELAAGDNAAPPLIRP